MSSHNCYSTRRALYNVFISPCSKPSGHFKSPNWNQRRFKKFTRERQLIDQNLIAQKIANMSKHRRLPDLKNNTREQMHLPQLPPQDQRTYNVPYDDEIQDVWISLVDRDGVYYPRVSLDETMRKINRLTEHLLQVTPADLAAGKLATCKIYSTIQLKAVDKARKREARGAKTRTVPAKTLELNWAIAEGDLAFKLSQMEAFLKEGRRVEVLLARKKRARVASQDECKALLKKVTEAAGRVPGAREEKSEGSVGEKMTLMFENKKAREKQANEREPE